MGRDFAKLAEEREKEAAQLTDMDIWKSVVEKAITLKDSPPEVIADILLSSIPDIGVIFAQLKVNYKKGNVSADQYHDILEILIDKVEQQKGMVDFDPLKYDENGED